MSTRSIIGRAIDGGFVGRYCHWDGYPSCRGAQLAEVYAQLSCDGDLVASYAIREHVGTLGYWSSFLTPAQLIVEQSKPLVVVCKYCDGTGTRTDMVVCNGCNGCSGSGSMVNPDRTVGWCTTNGDGWVSSSEDCGAEWAYLLSDAGVSVLSFRHDDGGQAVGMFGSAGAGWWRREALIPWEALASTDWDAVEAMASQCDPVPARL